MLTDAHCYLVNNFRSRGSVRLFLRSWMRYTDQTILIVGLGVNGEKVKSGKSINKGSVPIVYVWFFIYPKFVFSTMTLKLMQALLGVG